MSDAAVKVDPDFYNRRLLGADAGVEQSRRAYNPGSAGGGGRRTNGGFMGSSGGVGQVVPELLDYVVRQHSLLGLYLSLSPPDEADAEINWGFPHPQRAAIAGVTVVVPLFMALFVTGSWLWKASEIGVVLGGARLGISFVLKTFPDVEVSVRGFTLAVWPHFVGGILGMLALIWFVTAAAAGTGWSTMWLAFTSLLFVAAAEAGLRAGMRHFKWWVPAERCSFLRPWGDYAPVHTDPRVASYAPPRPMAAQPPVPTGVGFSGTTNGNGGGSEGLELSQEIGKAIGEEDDLQQESV